MGKMILFVDDDRHWRLVVETALEEAGYDVVAVRDVREAVLRLDHVKPGLIILDLDLGGENGLMLMKFVKQHHPEVPVILYTGMEHDDQFVQHMLQQGAQKYLRKGRPEDLLDAVQTALR
jgi:two-component system nitrogen regulation response regulator GlnG